MNEIGRLLIVLGIVLVAVGVVILVGGRIPGLGRLPGDISIRRGNVTFYVPLATSIVVSLVLTLVMVLINRR